MLDALIDVFGISATGLEIDWGDGELGWNNEGWFRNFGTNLTRLGSVTWTEGRSFGS